MRDKKIYDSLVLGLKALNISFVESQIDQLIDYINILIKWNKIFSLTAIEQIDDVIKYHILDGLTLVQYLNNHLKLMNTQIKILDLGSGMGVPAILLAIFGYEVLAIDSSFKKTSFLDQVKFELKLNTLLVKNIRLEAFLCEDKFDIITSRAFADVATILKKSMHLLNLGGCFLLMKGQKVFEEVKMLQKNTYEIIPVTIPFSHEKRFLIKIIPNG